MNDHQLLCFLTLSRTLNFTAAARELREETGLDLGDAEPELLGTTVYEEEFVDTYAVRLPFAFADVRPPRRGRESAPEG